MKKLSSTLCGVPVEMNELFDRACWSASSPTTAYRPAIAIAPPRQSFSIARRSARSDQSIAIPTRPMDSLVPPAAPIINPARKMCRRISTSAMIANITAIASLWA